MSTTFKVSDVKLSKDNLTKKNTFTPFQRFSHLTGSPGSPGSIPEACGINLSLPLIWSGSINGFLNSLYTAFSDHYPITISPDDIWLCITQGLALHINANPEKYRKQFVQHEGKLVLEHQNQYTKGSPDNDWTSSFSWFSEEIKKHIGKKHDLIVADFSTTGLIEKAVSEIVLMETMKNYFDYREMTMCGIPEITLLGTEEDWKNIRNRAAVLSEFDCSWWIDKLLPVLDQFVAAKQHNADKNFWQSFYNYHGGSGTSDISGYVNCLFPYIKEYNDKAYTRKNLAIQNVGDEVDQGCFPIGLSAVPFVWKYYEVKYQMEFLGGFVGTVQDPESLGVRTAMGWAVKGK